MRVHVTVTLRRDCAHCDIVNARPSLTHQREGNQKGGDAETKVRHQSVSADTKLKLQETINVKRDPSPAPMGRVTGIRSTLDSLGRGYLNVPGGDLVTAYAHAQCSVAIMYSLGPGVGNLILTRGL